MASSTWQWRTKVTSTSDAAGDRRNLLSAEQRKRRVPGAGSSQFRQWSLPEESDRGDVNGDGSRDIIFDAGADNFGEKVGILKGNGNGTFQAVR